MRKFCCILVCLVLWIPLSAQTSEVQVETDKKEEAPKEEKKEEKKGKWEGSVSLDAASNFHLTPKNKKTHNIGGVSAQVGYSREGFSFDVASKLSLEHRITGMGGGNITIADGDTTKKVDASVNEDTYLSSVSAVNLSFYKNPEDRFKAFYSYDYEKNVPNNYNLTSTKIEAGQIEFDYSVQTGDHHSGTHYAGASYEHDFASIGATLRVNANMEYYKNSKYSEWQTGNGKGEINLDKTGKEINEDKRYRTTPTSDYGDYFVQLSYSDKKLFDVNNLDFDFSVRYRLKNLNDHQSAANYIDMQWRDSTSAREDFRYRTVTITPRTRVRYSVGFYKLDLAYFPEYFAYKLDGNSHKGNVNKGRVAHLVNMTNTFNPWPEHNFILRWTREEERPEYLQICWFPRSSNIYANELYVGNPDIKTSITTTGDLNYNFKNEHFSVNVNLNCIYKPRKIAQTYSTEEYNGKEYRVYTWVNGGHSTEGNAELTLGWKNDKFDTAIGGNFNIYKGYSMSGSETKSNSYSFSGRFAYTLKTWKFQADAEYSSEVTRTYYSVSSLVDGRFIITKTFGDHFRVFLEGKDLFDRPITVKTTSEDETEIRYERHNDYKRLVNLGVTYKF